jgi:lipoprotein-releasing system permease protein
MRFEARLAKRYLFFIKRTSFVGILSWISLIGIVLGTTALVVVLSVFNGLKQYNKQYINTYQANLSISPTKGKFFEPDPNLLQTIKKNKKVQYASYSLADNALFALNNKKVIAKLIGIEKDFFKNENFTSCLTDSAFQFSAKPYNFFLASNQLSNNLDFLLETNFTPTEIMYPNGTDLLGSSLPSTFNTEYAFLNPIDLDNISNNQPMAWIDLAQMRSLLNEPNKISSIEIGLYDPSLTNNLKKEISKLLPNTLHIKTNEEQNAELFRAINIEKLFMFIALLFIIAISSLNIYFSLTMLVIEKNQDIKTLKALGATKGQIQGIFQNIGHFIAVMGISMGLLLGFVLCYLQQTYGLVKMYAGSLEQYYPCQMEFLDFAYTGLAVFLIAVLISKIPAQKAAKVSTIYT